MTAANGTWAGSTPVTYTFAWSRCDQDGGSCSKISGASANTFVLKKVDTGTTLRVTVTATNAAERVISDWVNNGVVTHRYQLSCYHAALRSLPEDMRTYTSAGDDINRAMLRARHSGA